MTYSHNNQPAANRYQDGALPVGAQPGQANRARNSRSTPLIDTISPGRTIAFGASTIPATAQLLALFTAQGISTAATARPFCAYYTLARYTTPENLPEGSLLGFRLDLMSFVADGATYGATDTILYTAAGVPPNAGHKRAAQTQYGTGAAIIIASGKDYRQEFATTPGEWKLGPHRLPTVALGPPYNSSPNSQFEHAYVIRPPNGDLCGSVTPPQRMVTTNRDQPFGARITPTDDIFVVVAINGAFAYDAAAVTNDGFPCVMNGELFVTPALDDRRLRDA
jgi:hypothetical protein